MAIKTKIKDGLGRENVLSIDGSNSAMVTVTGLPPSDLARVKRPFSQLMVNSSGATDMRVDGSTTSQDFYIEASQDGHRYVHTLAFTIADAGATLKKFGSITALTNGCELFYEDARIGTATIGSELKSNFDFVQMCNFEPFFGSGDDSFRAKNVISTSEAYIPILDMEDVFGITHGIWLPKGTNRRLTLRVNDNVSAIDRFDVKVFGYDLIEV